MKFEQDFVADVNAGVWTGLKWLAVVVLVAALLFISTGCSTKSYTSPEGAKITSTTFIYGPELNGMRAQDGNRTLEIEGQKSDLTNALKVIDKLSGAVIKMGVGMP